jgi:predicted ATPase
LGIVAETDEPMADIEAFIGSRRMLIVLDSRERVVTAVGAPNVVVLATSREPLRAAGEPIAGELLAAEALTCVETG